MSFSFIERLKDMFGLSPKSNQKFLGPDVSRAVQRNEKANENARRALEDLKQDGLVESLGQIAGKMK